MANRLPLLIVFLLLSGLLFTAGSAHAAPAEPGADALALEETFEGEAEEEGEELDCATGEEEAAEGEAAEGELTWEEAEEICDEEAAERSKKGAGSGAIAPEECILRSAHASAAVDEKSNKLKLTLGYTTYEPVTAKLEIGKIASVNRHLGRSGVLRLVKDLRKSNPRRLVVRIQLPSARSGGCPFRRLVLFPR